MTKKLFALLLSVNILLLSGCSLAKEPKATPDSHRLAGIYLVGSKNGERISPDENWVEYGSQQLDTEFGTLPIPNMILPAVYDDETGNFTFPGVEGFALFEAQVQQGDQSVITSACDLNESYVSVTTTDFGTNYELSGTLYVGQDAADTIWNFYHVYQAADGTIYLDGTGNSCQGSNFSTTVNQEETVKTQEKEGTESTTVKVSITEISETEKIMMHQYNAAGQKLETSQLPVSAEIPALSWHPDAAWAVIEEYHQDGVKRTALDRTVSDPNPVEHTIYVMDENGIGQPSSIILQ